MINTLILYHADCNDGKCAAAIAYNALDRYNAKIIPMAVAYGDPLPEYIYKADRIVIVDFSYPAEELEVLNGLGTPVTIIDHHASAEKALLNPALDKLEIIFDTKRSGAKLTWKYFNQKQLYPPIVVDMVEDRDLWIFKYPHTKSFHAYTTAYDFPVAYWRDLVVMNSENITALARRGEIIISREHKIFEDMYQGLTNVKSWQDYTIAVTPCIHALASDFAHYVLDSNPDVDFAVSWHKNDSNEYLYSLRSRTDGEVNVSLIAKQYGGGGHKNAAGIRTDFPEFNF